MMKRHHWCLGLVMLLAGFFSAAGLASARGQEFPFFCHVNADDEVDAFKLIPDEDAPAGFGMQLFSGHRQVAYIWADVSESTDTDFPNHLLVYAVQDRSVWQKDREILAYIAKGPSQPSVGDVRKSRKSGNQPFRLRPMTCQAYADD